MITQKPHISFELVDQWGAIAKAHGPGWEIETGVLQSDMALLLITVNDKKIAELTVHSPPDSNLLEEVEHIASAILWAALQDHE